MRRIVPAALLLLLLISCKMGSDILATTNAGDITRSEFEEWLQSRKISVEKVYDDRYAMSDYLKQLAIEKLTAHKGEVSGYANEKQYLTIEKAMYKNLLSSFYKESRWRELAFSEEAADISIIRIFYDPKEPHGDKETKRKLVMNILARLKAGEDFNILAGRYSEDAASRKSGRLGILPYSLMEDGLRTTVSTMGESGYTHIPVVIGNSFCLIKLHKKYVLNEKDLKNTVTDKNQYDRIVNYQREKYIDRLLADAGSRKDVISNIDRAQYVSQGEIIFSVNGENFTAGDLSDILNLFHSLKTGTAPANGFTLKEKKATAEKILSESIMALEGARMSLDKSPDFVRNWKYLKRATLSGAYKYSVLMNKVSVSYDEVLKEYRENRGAKYTKKKVKNGRELKIPLNFAEVKDSIKKEISRERLLSLKKSWDEETLEQGAFSIRDRRFLVE